MRWPFVCLMIASATLAFADPKPDHERAEKLYEEGLVHYNVSEYAQAIAAWKESYMLSKQPLLLFNIAQAYRLSGDCAQALKFYNSYSREDTAPPNQQELQDAIETCKRSTPPPPQPTAPIAGTPPPAPEGSSSKRFAGAIVGAVGVGMAGAAAYFVYDSRVQRDVLTKDNEWTQADVDAQTRGHRDNVLAWTFGIAGGAAIVTGAALFVLGGHETESVALVPGAHGATLAWRARF